MKLFLNYIYPGEGQVPISLPKPIDTDDSSILAWLYSMVEESFPDVIFFFTTMSTDIWDSEEISLPNQETTYSRCGQPQSCEWHPVQGVCDNTPKDGRAVIPIWVSAPWLEGGKPFRVDPTGLDVFLRTEEWVTSYAVNAYPSAIYFFAEDA